MPRLFVAADLDDRTRAIAERAARQLARRIDKKECRGRVRWVASENLHVTLRFIGNVDDARAAAIAEVLMPPLDTARFDLVLRDAGMFPKSGPPRVVWLGLARGVESLSQLHAEVESRLQPIGLEPETRPFAAHLTLGRFREGRRAARASVDRAVAGIRLDKHACRIDHITLYRSHQGPQGSRYEKLLRAPLK